MDISPPPLLSRRDPVPRPVPPAERAFRPDIEGLRAVAVLLVVAAHAGVPFLAGGYAGVDVFFVISGFLITGLLLGEAERTGRISVARFYARRAVRLLPAATVVLVATLVAARFLLPVVRLGEFTRDALAAAGYVANLRFAAIGTDYLSADLPPSPFQHFWSLAVEEQFYLFWPLLILAAAHLARRRRPLAAVLTVLVVASFALSVTETARSAPWAYFGPHTRAWELGAGALLALAGTRVHRLPGRAPLGWAGLAAIVLAAVSFDDATPFPGWRAAVPVAGAVALIASGGKGPGALLSVRPMRTVGRLSYAWYLWHWPVLLIGPAALGLTGTVRQRVLLAVAALVLAWATHRWVEDPLRHRPALRRRARHGLWVGAGLSAATAAAAALLIALPHGIPVGPVVPDLRAALASAPDPGAALTRAIGAGGGLRLQPANLTPALAAARGDRPRVWTDHCHVEWPVTAAPDGCVYGDPHGKHTMVLFGDSHAAQWFPALERIALDRHWRLAEVTKSSCSAADVPLWHEPYKRAYTECVAFHRSAIARIQLLRPDLVVIGSSFNYRPAYPEADAAAQWRAAWDRTYAQLRVSGARLVAIADTPYLGGSVPDCLAEPENQQDAGNCATRLRDSLRGRVQRDVFLSYAGQPRVSIVDPVGWFCTDVCPAIVGNLLVYRDSNHMTTAYAEALTPLLAARISAGGRPASAAGPRPR